MSAPEGSSETKGPRGPRLSADARRAAILQAARPLIFAQGYLPLSMEALAKAAGVSKALIYARFPAQGDLYAAVVDAELDDLEARGLLEAAGRADLTAAACAVAEIYFDHVAARGTVLHIVYRDPFMSGRLSPRARRLRDRVLGRLARAVRRDYGLPAAEAVAAVNMALTVPEEAGRLAFQGALTPERGRLVCRELILGCLSALGERPRA